MLNRRLYLFMIKSFSGPFIMTLFIAIFVLLMQWLWKYIDDLVGKGLELSLLAQLLFWASTTMIPLALPLAILLSSIMTFGNLGEHYELVALKSSGISLQKIMSPLVITAVCICIMAFYFSNYLLPFANLKMGSLLYDVREQKPALNIKEGVFYKGIDDFVIKVGGKDKDGVTLYNIMIYNHTSRMGNTDLTIAEKGTMEMTADKRYLIFTLTNGINYHENTDAGSRSSARPLQRTMFKEEFRRFDLSGFAMTRTNEEFFKDNYQMMNISQLQFTRDSLGRQLDKLKKRYVASVENNFFYTSRYCRTDSGFTDTSKAMTGEITDNFNEAQRIKIIERAMNLARGVKDQVFFFNSSNKGQTKFLNRYDIEWHRKFTLSVACLVLFFIGAPLGAIIRKGGLGLPVVVSVIFFVIFHVVSFTCEKMVRESVVTAYEGMWIPSLIFLPLGIFLTYKATCDSSLFDVYSYLRFFRRIFRGKEKMTINNQ